MTVIKYKLVKRSGATFYSLRYLHPSLGWREKSTKQKTKGQAERWAVKFLHDLAEDLSLAGRMTWKGFRRRYKTECGLTGVYQSAFNAFERLMKGVHYVDEITPAILMEFKQALLVEGQAPSTAAGYAKHLLTTLGWARDHGMIRVKPKFSPGSTDEMRGRPITLEEFERMLRACRRVAGDAQKGKVLQKALAAIWTVGLRRSEVLSLSWDDPTAIHLVGIDSRLPKIIFPRATHKGRRNTILPLLPDAVKLFRTWATKNRHGLLFPELWWQERRVTTADDLGKMISRVGRASRVMTCLDHQGEKRFATAHDLRRSFITRLAMNPKIPIAAVQMLARHKRIETTMKHYVHVSADQLGVDLYSALGAIPGATREATKLSGEAMEGHTNSGVS